jgi:hypothetical protein
MLTLYRGSIEILEDMSMQQLKFEIVGRCMEDDLDRADVETSMLPWDMDGTQLLLLLRTCSPENLRRELGEIINDTKVTNIVEALLAEVG